MPEWLPEQDEPLWRRAKAIVRKEYPHLGEDDARFWRLVTKVYEDLGGRVERRRGA